MLEKAYVAFLSCLIHLLGIVKYIYSKILRLLWYLLVASEDVWLLGDFLYLVFD